MRQKVLKLLLILFLLFSLFILIYNAKNPVQLDKPKININIATVEELNKLPLIGEKKAQYIIEYRNTKGKFNSLSELNNVEGIGEKTIQAIKSYVEVK